MPKKLIPIGSVVGGTRVYRGEFPRPPMELCYLRCKASVVNKRVCHLTLKITYTYYYSVCIHLVKSFFLFIFYLTIPPQGV